MMKYDKLRYDDDVANSLSYVKRILKRVLTFLSFCNNTHLIDINVCETKPVLLSETKEVHSKVALLKTS
jgi:hypothetical protein